MKTGRSCLTGRNRNSHILGIDRRLFAHAHSCWLCRSLWGSTAVSVVSTPFGDWPPMCAHAYVRTYVSLTEARRLNCRYFRSLAALSRTCLRPSLRRSSSNWPRRRSVAFGRGKLRAITKIKNKQVKLQKTKQHETKTNFMNTYVWSSLWVKWF